MRRSTKRFWSGGEPFYIAADDPTYTMRIGSNPELDATTLRHLEILEPLHHDAPRSVCLYGVLNRTVTPVRAGPGQLRLLAWPVRWHRPLA